MDDAVLATITANIESDFSSLSGQDADYEYSIDFNVEGSNETYHYDLTVLDTMEFTNEYGDTVKAIAFQDGDGNIYVHYNGTGDGNWGYNDVAYGGGPSKVQEESLAFFDQVMKDHGADANGVYVMGHSQGGNNAQYVTMFSEYGDKIDMCMAMDAPGFSEDAVERMKNLYGEEYFEAQRQKIYGYNGSSDFVSSLGQENIIPDDHITIIQTPSSISDFMNYHLIDGMMDGNNLNPEVDDYDAFHYFVIGLNEKIKGLPEDQQERIAELVMKAAEYFLGNDANGSNWKTGMTPEEIAELVQYVLPIIAEYFAENPEMLRDLLKQWGVPDIFAEGIYLQFQLLLLGIKTVMEVLEFLEETIAQIKEYLHSLTPGARYAANNPYFRADPAKLRTYASRLDSVNRRLMQLDRDLDGLYWQVGLADLANIVLANLITSYSVNVGLAKRFLNTAADKLEEADAKALGYMGG